MVAAVGEGYNAAWLSTASARCDRKGL